MAETKSFPTNVRVLVGVLLLSALGVGTWWFLRARAVFDSVLADIASFKKCHFLPSKNYHDRLR
jgi:hypothetical protein